MLVSKRTAGDEANRAFAYVFTAKQQFGTMAGVAVRVGHRTNSGQNWNMSGQYVICLDINEQVNPGSKIWLPNVRSILKPLLRALQW